MENRLEGGRTGLALVTAGLLILAMFALYASEPAGATHINDVGPVQDNCVEFQGGNVQETGSKSPSDFPDVTITLDSWDDLVDGEPHGFTFTVSGLTSDQWVEASLKSGTDVDELGPFGNGQHEVDGPSDHAISHVRLCVFEDTTTTTVADTTTTLEDTTTTVEDTTTTVEDTTTTTEATITEETTTTIEDEVLGTVVTTTTEAPTTTVEDEVLGTHVLPFTGIESDHMAMLAMALLGGGILTLVGSQGIRHGREE